jgi:putative sterol carrier protein
MAEYIKLPKGRCDLKFHQQFKNFKGIFKLTHGKNHFEIHIDKNNQVHDVLQCVVKTWKAIEKGKRKFTVPDVIVKKRAVELFNLVKGRPIGLAVEKIKAILIDRASVEG